MAATVAFLLLGASAMLQPAVMATPTPPSGAVGPTTPSSTQWDFGGVVGAGSGGTPIESTCPPGECDKYDLNVVLPQPDAVYYATHAVTLRYRCSWASVAPTDLDCFAFSPTGGETGPGKPDTTGTGANFEEIVVNNPASGHWSLRVDAAAATSPTPSHGVATLTSTVLPAGVPPVTPQVGDARFTNYDFSPTYQTRDAAGRPDAGEPSVGVNWETGKVMFMAGGQVTQLTYNNARPPVPTTLDVSPADSKANEDAILFTDHVTNRTWAMGLLLAGSYLDFTDTDGNGAPIGGWTPSVAYCNTCGPDHETLGAGPYHDPAPAHTYPHAVYYCAQTIVQDAYCGRSDDGGLHFSPLSAPLWTGQCTPIHGHVRVGATGVVYVPNESCTDAAGKPRQGVAVSIDNGTTYTLHTIPDSTPGTSDPSVTEDRAGNTYFTYQGSNGHPMVAVSHDHGVHWDASVDVGQFSDPTGSEDGLVHGVQNTEFSEVIAGDGGRAAYAFFGTGTQGAYQDGAFPGTWYMFVSYTFDGGKTWRTVNATPGDPVQRGCIWNGGLVNACRNMLDFNDIGIDKQGRVYVAYTDGCTTNATYSCDKTPGIHGWNNVQSGDQAGCKPSELADVESSSTCTFARLSAIVRQVCGRGLIAAYDPGFNEADYCVQAASTQSTPTPGVTTSTGSGSPNTGTGRPLPNIPLGGLALGGAVISATLAWRRRDRGRRIG